MELQSPITEIKGIGAKKAASFAKVGIHTVEDLLEYYPRAYEKFGGPIRLSEAEDGEKAAVYAFVLSVSAVKRFKHYQIFTAQLKTEEGEAFTGTWFNQPYLRKCFQRGSRYVFRGIIRIKGNQYRMEQPLHYTPADYERLTRALQPRYPLTAGLTEKMVAKAVRQVFEDGTVLIPEYLPQELLGRYGLMPLWESLKEVHFPASEERMLRCRNRLVFDEFLLFILALRHLKESADEAPNQAPMIEVAECSRLIEGLPYELTGAQKRVWREICADLTGERAMSRLIQGDVGSGKTILAVLALVMAGCNGYQGALMAPTEVLAKQHFQSVKELFEKHQIPLKPVLLVGSQTQKEKKAVCAGIESGEADVIIGTHALIQEKVAYHRLGLVVTDEQHRFGVRQRESLANKGLAPHVLVMSATPIPRTLAIIVYGDLDISVLDELPKNRLPIKNCVVDESYRATAFKFMEKECAAGHQVYIICPMVEENEELELQNVTDYTENLREILPRLQIACLHGRMKPREKNEIMERFAAGEIQILVSTTVVEVGIDVPNATVMMVENSERFGLAQLHQLRGRVGRGKAQSYCIFMTASGGKDVKKRLEVLNQSNDGFFIASEDLKLRGPGDLFGIRQSGILEFRIGDVFQDAKVLQQASEAAGEILAADPELKSEAYRPLKEKLDAYLKRGTERLNL